MKRWWLLSALTLTVSLLQGAALMPRECVPYRLHAFEKSWIAQQSDPKAALCALGYIYEARAKHPESPVLEALDLSRIAQVLQDLKDDYGADVNRSMRAIRHRFDSMNRKLRNAGVIGDEDRLSVALARHNDKGILYQYDEKTLRLRIEERPMETERKQRCFPLYEDPELRWKTGKCLTPKQLKKAFGVMAVKYREQIYYLAPGNKKTHKGGDDETAY